AGRDRRQARRHHPANRRRDDAGARPRGAVPLARRLRRDAARQRQQHHPRARGRGREPPHRAARGERDRLPARAPLSRLVRVPWRPRRGRGRRYTRPVNPVRRFASRLAALPLAVALAALAFAQAQPLVELELGLGGNVVVGAWNPLRVVARDVPLGRRVEVTFDQRPRRSGEVPFRLQLPVSGGPGLSVVERTVYVAPFASVPWALVGDGAVVASGSIPGRGQDSRPLDVVLSRRSGSYAAAFGESARVVDVSAAQLPLAPEAYDGVRSVVVDGTAAAPRLEAVAAAAAGGAVVVVHGEMPASHAELRLLAAGPVLPLGAGAVLAVSGSPGDVARAVESFAASRPARSELIAAAAARPLVTPPAPLRQQVVVAAAVAFSVLAVTATRLFGAPGLASALLLAVLVSGAA